jgi:hypothetical protein
MAISAQNEEVVLKPNNTTFSATYTSPDLQNLGGKDISVYLNTTNIGTATLTVAINGKDPASGTYFNLLTSTAVSTNTFTRLKIGPAIAASANAIAQDVLTPTFQIVATLGGTGNAVASLGYTLNPSS